MKNGLFNGISNAEYHGGAGISKSGLDLVAQSPLHYWSAYLDPNRQAREETPAMAIGTGMIVGSAWTLCMTDVGHGAKALALAAGATGLATNAQGAMNAIGIVGALN